MNKINKDTIYQILKMIIILIQLLILHEVVHLVKAMFWESLVFI